MPEAIYVRNRILLLCMIVTFSVHCSAQLCNTNRYIDSTFSVTKTYNIEYQQAKAFGSIFSTPYFLDIYEPTSDTLTYRPLIVFLFGGGYLIGDKLFPPANDYCTYWAERGFICVAVNYRIGFNSLFTESAERAVYRSTQDLQAALRFLAENRNLYGVDTANVIASGNSAGAITSIHNAFMEQSQAPISYQGFGFGLDSDDLGGIYSSGNTFWNNQEVMTHGLISNWGGIIDTSLIGDAFDDYIPTILFHGDQDSVVNYNSGHPFGYPLFPLMYGSVPISSALANNNIPFYFETFENAGHEPELINPLYLDSILMISTDFIYEHVLKPEVISVTGNTVSATTLSENYIVNANENFIIGCVNVNNGAVTNINTNHFDILWNSIGLDTIEIIVFNNILAKDTFLLPVNISDICTFLPLNSFNNSTICANDSLIINGTTYNVSNYSGTEVFSNIGPGGCDSTVTISLNVLPELSSSENSTICANESLTINGTIYNASNYSGTEVFSNIGPHGCDSTVTISLNVLPELSSSENSTICANESLTINGTIYNASNYSGTEVFSNIGPHGCDSTVTISLNVLPELSSSENSTICANESLTINGTIYNASNYSGTEVFSNIGPYGCDSTVTISLNVLPTIDTSITVLGLTLSSNQNGGVYQWIDCDLGSLISGETNQIFIVDTDGNYAVQIDDNGCIDTSACYTIVTIGLLKNELSDELRMYPNPTSGQITIEFSKSQDEIIIEVENDLGQLVSSQLYKNTDVIDIEIEGNTGYYLATIKNSIGEKSVFRLLKF